MVSWGRHRATHMLHAEMACGKLSSGSAGDRTSHSFSRLPAQARAPTATDRHRRLPLAHITNPPRPSLCISCGQVRPHAIISNHHQALADGPSMLTVDRTDNWPVSLWCCVERINKAQISSSSSVRSFHLFPLALSPFAPFTPLFASLFA